MEFQQKISIENREEINFHWPEMKTKPNIDTVINSSIFSLCLRQSNSTKIGYGPLDQQFHMPFCFD